MANNTEILQQILTELQTQRGQEKSEERQERKQKRRESAKSFSSGSGKLGKTISTQFAKSEIGKATEAAKGGIRNAIVTGIATALVIPFVEGFANVSKEAFGDDATLGERIASGFAKLITTVLGFFGKKMDASKLAQDIKKGFDTFVDYLTSEDGIKKQFKIFKEGMESLGKLFTKLTKFANQLASGDLKGAYNTLMSNDAEPTSPDGYDPSKDPMIPNIESSYSDNLAAAAATALKNKSVTSTVKMQQPKPNFKVGDTYQDSKGRTRKITGFNPNTGKALSGFAKQGLKSTTTAMDVGAFNSKMEKFNGGGTTTRTTMQRATGLRKFLGKMVSKVATPLMLMDGVEDAYNTFDAEKGNYGEAFGTGFGSYSGTLYGGKKGWNAVSPFANMIPYKPLQYAVKGAAAMAGAYGGEAIGEKLGGYTGKILLPDFIPSVQAASENSSSSLLNSMAEYSNNIARLRGEGGGKTGGNTTIIQDNSQKSSVSMNSGTMKTTPGFTDALEAWMVR